LLTIEKAIATFGDPAGNTPGGFEDKSIALCNSDIVCGSEKIFYPTGGPVTASKGGVPGHTAYMKDDSIPQAVRFIKSKIT
jgi:hypothetical protein